jgi:hypothetical protein
VSAGTSSCLGAGREPEQLSDTADRRQQPHVLAGVGEGAQLALDRRDLDRRDLPARQQAERPVRRGGAKPDELGADVRRSSCADRSSTRGDVSAERSEARRHRRRRVGAGKGRERLPRP